MLAVASIVKFVRDNLAITKRQAEAIIRRARKAEFDGVISGSPIEEIMGDPNLAREYEKLAVTDPEYVGIGLAAIRRIAEGPD